MGFFHHRCQCVIERAQLGSASNYARCDSLGRFWALADCYHCDGKGELPQALHWHPTCDTKAAFTAPATSPGIDASYFSSDMCHATAEQVAAVADAYEVEVKSRRDAKAIAPLRALLDACVLPALVEAWKARNPHATAVVDPSQGWAVVCLGLGPWKGASRLWWAGGEAYGARAEALLDAAWAEASDAVARGWKPEGRR
jgi:hypothetical protein